MTVHTWGRSGIGDITVRWRKGEETPCEAAVRSIERRTGLRVCGGPCPQGQSFSHGKVESNHYSATLGTWSRFGGYDVRGEVWFAIPVQS